jgi:hypothetical protein
MPKKMFIATQMVNSLIRIERQLAGGDAQSAVCKRAGVTEQIYRR